MIQAQNLVKTGDISNSPVGELALSLHLLTNVAVPVNECNYISLFTNVTVLSYLTIASPVVSSLSSSCLIFLWRLMMKCTVLVLA